jgi:hypothetical protein
MMVHAYNPSAQEAEPRGSQLNTILGKCFSRPISKTTRASQHQWLTPIILTTQEAETRRISVQSQPRQRVHETLYQKKAITKKVWWSGSSCRPRVQTLVPQKNKWNKITRAKWTGVMAQMVERLLCESLLCKHEVLRSNPSPNKKKKKKKRRRH